MESLYGIPLGLGLRQNGFTDMLQDEDRNSKYYEALKSAINERHQNGQKAEVLDIGTGAGLLALMAAKAGADQVWACEMNQDLAKCAKQVIRKNNYSSKIVVIDKISTELKVGRGKDLPRRANILVTEIFATSLLFEEAIATFNHAHAHLLTDDCIVIPQKAIIYAQIVDCPYFEEFSFVQPVPLPNGSTVTFPEEMLTCSDATSADVDETLSSLNTNKFKKLSNTLTVFEFNWGNKSTAEENRSKVEFISNRSGTANAVFTWWDLHMDNSEENIISLRPTWAGGTGPWRFHWNQTVYFGQTSIELKEVTQCILEGFHDETDFWFRLSKCSGANLPMSIPMKKQCTCFAHRLLNSYRIGKLNNHDVNSKYAAALAEVIKPGKSVCLNLSEPSGSILHLISGKLGAKKVFVIESAEKRDDLSCTIVVDGMAIEQNGLNNVTTLHTRTGFITSSDFENMIVDVVIGDPYFGGLEEPYDQRSMRLYIPRIVEWKPERYPWHQLLFGYYLDSFRKRGLIAPGAKILPFKAVLRGVAIQFENLHKINAPITKVFGDLFDFSDYVQMIQKNAVNGGRLDHQNLWQYPGTASSSPFDIMTFDFTQTLETQTSRGHVKLDHIANGIGLWMEWYLTEEIKTSTGGPISDIHTGHQIEWDMHAEQGVYYIWEGCTDTIKYRVDFTPEDVNLKFKFSGPPI